MVPIQRKKNILFIFPFSMYIHAVVVAGRSEDQIVTLRSEVLDQEWHTSSLSDLFRKFLTELEKIPRKIMQMLSIHSQDYLEICPALGIGHQNALDTILCFLLDGRCMTKQEPLKKTWFVCFQQLCEQNFGIH